MIYIAFILWILIWGLAGYFTVRAIQIHIQSKRWERYMKARAMNYQYYRMRHPEEVSKEISDNPFEKFFTSEES